MVFIAWDEGEGGSYAAGESCATNTSDVSCRLPTLVISPSTKAGARSGTPFNHYSLLGTAEQLLRLSKLGPAADYPTMVSAFNLQRLRTRARLPGLARGPGRPGVRAQSGHDGRTARWPHPEVPDAPGGAARWQRRAVLGTAVLMPDDDTRQRCRTLPYRWDAAVGRALATTPLTVRIDLDPA